MTYSDGSIYFGNDLLGFFLIALAVTFYLLPTLVAWARKVAGIGGVFVVNLLLGWTLIGWLVALVMAFVMESTLDRALRRATQMAILKSAGGQPPNPRHL